MKAPQCFMLDGAIVRGNPDMDDETRAAVRELIAAARRTLQRQERIGDHLRALGVRGFVNGEAHAMVLAGYRPECGTWGEP